jgi:hypothetical protein
VEIAGRALLLAVVAVSAPLNPARLPALPAQGLVLRTSHGVLLETTTGQVIGELRGFTLGPPQNPPLDTWRRDFGLETLAEVDPRLTVLYDRRGNGWLLDVARRRLDRVAKLQAPLANGADVRIIVDGHPSSGYGTKTVIERNGRKLLEALSVAVIANRYAVTTYALGPKPTRLLDLVTGRQVTFAPHCVAVAVLAGGSVVTTCTPEYLSGHATIKLLRRDGSTKLLSTFAPGLVPERVWLSPDERWLLAYLAPGCGLGWTAVLPIGGGAARFVTGRSSSPPFSSGLGWTKDNRIVATVSATKKSGCEGAPTTGTYLIDPRTLTRTLVSRTEAWTLWGSAA